MSSQPRVGFLTSVAVFIIVVALEAAFLTFVWNRAVVSAFGVSEMLFGHMFLMLVGIKTFFRDIFRLGEIHYVLTQIREIQYFTANNSTSKSRGQDKKTNVSDDVDK